MKKLILSKKQYSKLKNIIIERSILNEQTQDQIKQVQQRLKDCFNAALGTSGPNKDGVDGIAGNKTKIAIETHTKYRFDQEKDVQNPSLNSDCSSKCIEQPKVVPPGSPVTQQIGYFYDSTQGKCVGVTGQNGPFGSIEECEACKCGSQSLLDASTDDLA